MLRIALALSALLALPSLTFAQEADDHPLSKLPLRTIGPALTSGRVADFAVHPDRHEVRYVAMASGGVWKTENDGITWTPIFDQEGSYAIGVVTLNPANPEEVWVGTGENNAQRSVGYGDGVYRSRDGGASWEHLGLRDSGHIGMIRFHPETPATVYVAAQGPLWRAGGDRGLYRSTDDGASWERILDIDEHTGVNEFVIHPRDPDILVATTYQRRRHVWTLINGGPGSGVHKSTDGGRTWRRIAGGLPGGPLGRIGLAAAPSSPDTLYVIVEADAKGRGVYRSTDFGERWQKRSDHLSSSPQYYNELVVDPLDPDRLYALDTFTHVSEDGGESWQRLSFENRHVDDHALWIDPDRTEHLLIGGDGGVFESWDRGRKWRHVTNLPATQFYRVTPDNDAPFYNVCGGTQDNHTLCGPVRTTYTDGITNADWWIPRTGDGFKAQFDPQNPDIVYAQYQYGGLHRFDRVTGESVTITPLPGEGENTPKWNWNAPLVVSPHDPARLYYAAEKVYRSDDRGDSWRAISPDLSRGLDRNTLEVMGRVWSVDAIAKNASTSMYGSIIALDESPLEEGLIYAGTDDGLLQVTTDGGENWTRVTTVPGVPDQSLVEDIVASRHDAAVAYAVIDNHKQGDYRPYVLITRNRGKSWSPITGNLPERGTAHTLAEDHEDPGLLFVGTEFGLFFTQEGGGRWHELTGLPTIAVRDLEIQRRETDLVIGTFGRGIWILDDYSPLRTDMAGLNGDAKLFPVRAAWQFVPDARRGWGGKGDFGVDRYTADNPPHGAVLRYYLAEGVQTRRDARLAREAEVRDEGGDNPYPDWDTLRNEDREEDPTAILTISDSEGRVVRRLKGPVGKGLHQVSWDLRHAAPDPVDLSPPASFAPWMGPPEGPLAVPGAYTANLAIRRDGVLEDTGQSQRFEVRPLFSGGLVAGDPQAVLDFQQETARLYAAVAGADGAAGELDDRIAHVLEAIDRAPGASEEQATTLRNLRTRLRDLQVQLDGDRTLARRAEPVPMSISERLGALVYGHWSSQAAVPGAYRDSRTVAEAQFGRVLEELRAIDAELRTLEQSMDAIGAPWTPGRIPDWP